MTTRAPMPWRDARAAAFAAGTAAKPESIDVPLSRSDGLVTARPLTTLTDLPAFPTSSVDGYAIRGQGPWRITGRTLAGGVPSGLAAGEAVEIATGAMVPAGTEQIIRVEDSTVESGWLTGGPARPTPDWRLAGEEAKRGEHLLDAGTVITPAVAGLAASCGYDTIPVIPPPRAGVVVFGDELLTQGTPGDGRVRDSLGPQLPGWLRRLGAATVNGLAPLGPVADTLDAHITAITSAADNVDVVCTTGGTMHGPVDHLHPALTAIGARYVVNTVAVRPGYPMLLAMIPGQPAGAPTFIAGLPGNPQSAIVAMVSLVQPLLCGLRGLTYPEAGHVRLGESIAGRGDHTHLALIRLNREDGLAYPLRHAGSAMLRGLAHADGFAIIEPGADDAAAGSVVAFVPLPLGADHPPVVPVPR